jgi:hypothetical protein
MLQRKGRAFEVMSLLVKIQEIQEIELKVEKRINVGVCCYDA